MPFDFKLAISRFGCYTDVMAELNRIHISFRVGLAMIGGYLRSRLFEQVRSVSFIILYLLAFQMLVLGTTPANALRVSVGVGLFIFGLMFFLEGLLLGLMPLGELVGLQLPKRGGIGAITVFGLLLGMGATLAEPALASLRAAGQTVCAWEAPLLFRLLERAPEQLVMAIGIGVGAAVAVGMIRLYFGWSIKPVIYVTVPVLLAASVACVFDTNLVTILGLAWDAGAVTTGAVTVPLVLALGIGVSRASGHPSASSGGFGLIMLASAFPVLGVLTLGWMLNGTTARPMDEAAFFAPTHRAEALHLFECEEALARHAFQRGEAAGRQAFFADPAAYEHAVLSLKDPDTRDRLLGPVSLSEWLLDRAADNEIALLAGARTDGNAAAAASPVASVIGREWMLALRAVVPLTLLLLLVLLVILRERPRHSDEIVLGIGLALIGMTLLGSGIRLGLAPLGDEVGRPLPRVFQSMAREEGRIVIEPFDPERLLVSYDAAGAASYFLYLKDDGGAPRAVAYDPARYDPEKQRYTHVLKRPPLFGPGMTLAGIALVFAFAFGLGFGSTLAEPALSALGRTVEELTVGTVKRNGVVRSVSVGVGIGLVVGVVRILYDIPIIWLLVPPYLLLLPLTRWSEEDFAGIAWDCGGVTTGSVTVPLVLAMGLGIGGELDVVDGFGVLAMASVYPIISVLVYGLVVRTRQRRGIDAAGGKESSDERDL